MLFGKDDYIVPGRLLRNLERIIERMALQGYKVGDGRDLQNLMALVHDQSMEVDPDWEQVQLSNSLRRSYQDE